MKAQSQTDFRVRHLTVVRVEGKKGEKIFRFMLELDKAKYLAWNDAHRDYQVLNRTVDFVGSIIYFDEKIGNLRLKSDWEVTKVVENALIELKSKKFGVPIYLNLTFVEKENYTDVTHEVLAGYSKKNIINWFIKNFFFTKYRMIAIEKHAIEEFKYLE
jgi:hypothetical protein